jgi:hypothetical protein
MYCSATGLENTSLFSPARFSFLSMDHGALV